MTELTQPEIVAMLHEEIDTAPERLINELGMRVLSLFDPALINSIDN